MKIFIRRLGNEYLETISFENFDILDETFEKLSKNINVIDIPEEQRDAVIARILSETHHWEVKDNDDK